MLSTLNIALCSLRLILPYSHSYPHSILPYAVHSLMQSTLIITLCCPRSMLFTLNIALQPRCTRSILPYAVHARYCLVLSTLNIALQTRCPHWILPYADNAQWYPRSILPYADSYAVHAQCYLMQFTLNIALCSRTLNIALQTRCPHWILPYAVNAQYCLMLTSAQCIHAQYCLVQSTLNIALSCPCLILPYSRPRLILPYSHAACPHSILPYAVHDQYCLMLSTNQNWLMLSTLNIALCCQCSILPYAGHAQYCLILTSSCLSVFSRTCSSCLDLHALLTALAIYLRLWLSYLYYTILPKALTTLASIHQYIHTSTSNINNTATHTLTCNMINNNITCSIIKDFIIHSLTLLLTYSACVLSRCASKYMYILTLTHLIIGNMSGSANKYILTLLPYILKLLKPQMVHLSYAIESVASMVTYILAMLLCVTKLTIYILLCINARTLHNLRLYITGTCTCLW